MQRRIRESIYPVGRAQVPLRLSVELHSRLLAHCDSRHISISSFATEVLATALARAAEMTASPAAGREGLLQGLEAHLPKWGESGERVTVTVRIPNDSALTARASLKHTKVSFNALLTALVSARLAKEAKPGL